jgi:ceramide glucosyltransferase
MMVLAYIAALCAVFGVVQQLIGTLLVRRFTTAAVQPPRQRPAISILKPLCGVEPLTQQALESFFLIDYPEYQLVFGVQSETDPVLALLASLRARYPARDVALVLDATQHGLNRKVSNLINMLPMARHETLVISDADIHAPTYYLDRVAAALEVPGVGLVTSPYTAVPGAHSMATALGSYQINYSFLPGALLARELGRQDCMGVTMALRKTVLAEAGGLPALANHLADDQVLGRLVVARGYKLALAQLIPGTTVPEADLRALYRHELRWARTIRALVPVPYAASVLQISLLWGVLAVLFSGGAVLAWGLLAAVLAARVLLARQIDAALQAPPASGPWLFLLRDSLSTIIYIASFAGGRVDWRGQMMQADAGKLS